LTNNTYLEFNYSSAQWQRIGLFHPTWLFVSVFVAICSAPEAPSDRTGRKDGSGMREEKAG